MPRLTWMRTMKCRLSAVTRALTLPAILTMSLPCSGIADEKAKIDSRAPSAWGILSPVKACVIFREYQKTKVGFYVLILTTKTHAELEVIESTNGYVMDPTKWVEDEASMHELDHRAVKDQVRYVKIQDKYTPAELEAARALCQKENVTE